MRENWHESVRHAKSWQRLQAPPPFLSPVSSRFWLLSFFLSFVLFCFVLFFFLCSRLLNSADPTISEPGTVLIHDLWFISYTLFCHIHLFHRKRSRDRSAVSGAAFRLALLNWIPLDKYWLKYRKVRNRKRKQSSRRVRPCFEHMPWYKYWLINEFLNIYLFICIEDNCKLTVRLSYVPDVTYGSPWTAKWLDPLALLC